MIGKRTLLVQKHYNQENSLKNVTYISIEEIEFDLIDLWGDDIKDI